MIGWLLVASSWGSVSLESPPVVGEITVVEVLDDDDQRPRSGETVRVVHRPGLAGEEEQAIGITDGRGRVRWTPSAAGVATVRAGDEHQPVLVATSTPRIDTWLLLGLLVAAGAAAVGVGAWEKS